MVTSISALPPPFMAALGPAIHEKEGGDLRSLVDARPKAGHERVFDPSRLRLDAFENGGDTLTDADAHRDQREAAAGALQLAGRGQGETRPRGAERMADRDRAAIRVDPAVVERDFEPAQAG